MEFEIHITVDDLKMDEKESFIEVCKTEGVKPVMIVLEQGDYVNQPMITSVIKRENFEEANIEIEKIAKQFRDNGFTIVRKKVEISPKEETYFHNPIMNSKPYFEWHGKVQVDDLAMLKKICEGDGGHISRNSLKADGKLRFVTVREYESSRQFYERVGNIHRILDVNGIELLKEEFELCIYDSREELDKGWIAK